MYNFHTNEDGLIEVTAVNVSNFPRESEPPNEDNRRRRLQSPTILSLHRNHDEGNLHPSVVTNRSLQEDGSVVDVICFYTRKALCYEANQALTCNLDQYKYLMDSKCALAISETVS